MEDRCDLAAFSAAWTDVAAARVKPATPRRAAFSTDRYLVAYADVQRDGMDPLLRHFVYGQAEHRTAFAT